MSCIHADFKSKKHFEGVFAADKLPIYERRRPAIFVVNTDEHHGPGKHWVVIYLPKWGPPEFFDSVGRSPSSYHRRFKRLLRGSFIYNKRPVQRPDTYTCGLFCIYSIYNRCRGRTFRNILRSFNYCNLDFNEGKVITFMKALKGNVDIR